MALVGKTFAECNTLISSVFKFGPLKHDWKFEHIANAVCVMDTHDAPTAPTIRIRLVFYLGAQSTGRFLVFYDMSSDALICFEVEEVHHGSDYVGYYHYDRLKFVWNDYGESDWKVYLNADKNDFKSNFRIHQLKEHSVTKRVCKSILNSDVLSIVCNYVTFRKTQAQVSILNPEKFAMSCTVLKRNVQ